MINQDIFVKDFLKNMPVDTIIRESLYIFFEDNNLLSSKLCDIPKDVKMSLIKKIVHERLFDYEFSDLLKDLQSGNLLVSEDIIWSEIENELGVKIPEWVRKVNSLFNTVTPKESDYPFYPFMGISFMVLVVGTTEKGVVSLSDVLSLISTENIKDEYSALLFTKGNRYIVAFFSSSVRDYFGDMINLPECWENYDYLIPVLTGVQDRVITLEELGFDNEGFISLEMYDKLSKENKDIIDKLISVQDDNGFRFGLGYVQDQGFALAFFCD